MFIQRIRNIKDLSFYKPERSMVFKHTQYFFKEAINRDLVEKHNADMIRTAMPVKAEKILRRFGKNREHKLYFVFCELGRVLRTVFLLEYITELDLREMIRAATCKSEKYNQFARLRFFIT